jgi:UDP-glucose 4-epimerase
MRVLVTGGGGFIGQYVCQRLVELDCEPVLLDRSREAGDNHSVYLGDVRDASSVSESVYHTDGVIHLAGVLGTQETIVNPLPAVETNIIGSLNVFQACALHKKRGVYIAVGNHWMNNPYSITKTTAERFALMYNKERGTKIAVVRGLNAYGPGQKSQPVRKIIPNFILPALRGEPITIYGDGSQVMDMIYVTDIADVLVRALLEDHDCYDSVFEAGTGVATTVLQIAQEVYQQTRPAVPKGTETVTKAMGLCGKDIPVGTGFHFAPMRPGEPEHSEVLGHPVTLAPLYAGRKPQLMSLSRGISLTIPYYAKQVRKEEAA